MKPMRGACSRRAVKAARIFGAIFFLRERVEFLGQFGPIRSDESQSMRVMVPPNSERISKIRQNGRIAIGIGVFS